MIFDALLAGALIGLAAGFGADALHRRDRMMGRLALSCFFMALRHVMAVVAATTALPPGLAGHLESACATLGFIAIMLAFWELFPSWLPRGFPVLVLAGAVPNLLRCGLAATGSWADYTFLRFNYAYMLAGSLATLVAIARARTAGDPMGRRLLWGFVLALVPFLVEVTSLVAFRTILPVGALGIVILAISVAVSWLWVINLDLQRKGASSAAAAAGWRALVPGTTWNTQERSPFMDATFGQGWEERIQERMTGLDGTPYLVRQASLGAHGVLGSVAAQRQPQSADTAFLKGWCVALGVDEGPEFQRVKAWLEAWGATIEAWGTVPPRKGPYPSLLIWAREPAILSVWREDDLTRRKPRWIQAGGVPMDGPHARLPWPMEEGPLRNELRRLLSFGD